MKCLCVVFLVLISVLGWSEDSFANGEAPAAASSTTTTSDAIANTCSDTDQFTFTDIGVAMDATIMGVEVGSSIADSTAVVLPDGRVRMYFQYLSKDRSQGAHYSAISSDGVHFTLEAGTRLGDTEWKTEWWGPHIKAKWLSDGRLRIYKGATPGTDANIGIISYISSDGLTFTKEDGFRITPSAAGLTRLSHLTIVSTSDGKYRGYFSNMPQGTDPNRLVKSATSSDLLTWTMDSGVRVGTGSTTLPDDSAEQPHALQRPDGCVTLFFYRSHHKGQFAPALTYYSTSKDGVAFTNAYSLDINGNGPDIVRLNDGTYLLYYDVGNETQGFSIRVGKLELTPSVSLPDICCNMVGGVSVNGSSYSREVNVGQVNTVDIKAAINSSVIGTGDIYVVAYWQDSYFFKIGNPDQWWSYDGTKVIPYQKNVTLADYTINIYSGLLTGLKGDLRVYVAYWEQRKANPVISDPLVIYMK